MTTTMFWRLVWKESRVQWAFGAALLLFGLLLQLVLRVLGPGDLSQQMGMMLGIGTLITLFYTLGSAAILFAGEREEGTDLYLRLLPVNLRTLFAAKVGFLVSSALFVVLVLSIAAFGMTFGRAKPVSIDPAHALQVSSMLVGLVLWGLLCSLKTSRVFLALFAAAAAFSASTGIISENAAEDTRWYCLLDAVLLVAVGVTAARWRRPHEGVALPVGIRLWRGFTLERALAKPVVDAQWLRFVKGQLWLELRHARSFALWYFVAVSALIFTTWGWTLESNLIGAWWMVAALTPLVVGSRCFAGEQYRRRYQFQVNRGTAPCLLWVVKQGVWFSVMLALQVALLAVVFGMYCASAAHFSSSQLAQLNALKLFPVLTHYFPEFAKAQFSVGVGPAMEAGLLLTCLLFAIGQCCSLLIRRTVLSVAVTGAAAVVAIFWLFVNLALGVPGLLSTGVPVVMLMTISLWRMRGWLLERDGLRDWLKLGAACTAGIAIPVIGVASYRVLEVMTAGRIAYPLTASPAAIVAAYDLEQFRPPPEALATAQMYSRADELIVFVERSEEEERESSQLVRRWRSGWQYALSSERQWLARNQEALALTLEATHRDDCAMSSIWHSLNLPDEYQWSLFRYGRSRELWQLLRMRAAQLEHEGQLAQAWTYHLAGVRMARHYAMHNVPSLYADSHRGDTWTLDDVWRWAARREQTTELLQQAADDLAEEFARFPSLTDGFRVQTAAALAQFEAHGLQSGASEEQVIVALSRLPWERARARRFIVKAGNRNVRFGERFDRYGASRSGAVDEMRTAFARDWFHQGYEHVDTTARASQNGWPVGLYVPWPGKPRERFWDLPGTTPFLFGTEIGEYISEPTGTYAYVATMRQLEQRQAFGYLAAYAYRLRHGRFAEDWRELSADDASNAMLLHTAWQEDLFFMDSDYNRPWIVPTNPFGGPLLYRMTGRHAEQWTEAEYQLTPSERGTSVQ